VAVRAALNLRRGKAGERHDPVDRETPACGPRDRPPSALLARRIEIHAVRVEIQWKTTEELACQAIGDAHLFSAPDDGPGLAATPQGRR
jgi:hypothetical protein